MIDSVEHCETRILVWTAWIASDGRPGIALCHRPPGHSGEHHGPLDHEVQTIWGGVNLPEFSWRDDDRRSFRGPLDMCPWTRPIPGSRSHRVQRCILPTLHPGNHAT